MFQQTERVSVAVAVFVQPWLANLFSSGLRTRQRLQDCENGRGNTTLIAHNNITRLMELDAKVH
jgi:hypothetical protein